MTTIAYLGATGIVLSGDVDAEGCEWSWSGSDPWSPSPGVKDVTGDNVNDHGSWDATRFYGSRTYALEGYVQAPTHEALHRAKSRLFDACGLSLNLRVVEPSYDRSAVFRRNGEVLWSEINPTTARFSAPLWAGDPRAYSTAATITTSTFPSTSGGLTWSATWPATWGATVVTGDMILTDVGNETAWPVFRIDGPVTNPAIVNMSTGEAMHFDITLLAGQWLTVDTGTHQVLADGDVNAPRRDKFWGDWFGLPPGSTTVRFTGDTAGVGALLTATYRSAWI